MTSWRVHCGDVRKFCARYDGPPFMAMLTDPPYELGFMGKDWDKSGIAFNSETWAAFARHLLPGAFGMTFASSRGWHRVACAIEDAGLRIHPTVWCWVQGAGFPKATRIKGHEEFAGHRYGLQALKPAVEPIIVWQVPYEGKPVDSIVKHGAGALNIEAGRIGTGGGGTHCNNRDENGKCMGHKNAGRSTSGETFHGPDTAGGRWPANFALQHHPDCRLVGVKKVKGTLKAYTRKIDVEPGMYGGAQASGTHKPSYSDADGLETVEEWRCVESCPVRKLDEQSGQSKSTAAPRGGQGFHNCLGRPDRPRVDGAIAKGHTDSGGASRFFFNSDWIAEVEEGILSADPVRYQAKAGRKERDAGLEELPKRTSAELSGGGGVRHEKADAYQARKSARCNPHPTIKPIRLCTWLAKLLLPPVEYAPRRILVPFSGAGSECAAAGLAGWDEIVGIEREAEYAEIARARLRHWLPDATEST